MSKIFASGDRVQVSDDFFWAGGATGTVAKAPEAVTALSGPWDNGGLTRQEISSLGENTVQWVWFDEPQRDADGDGSYRGGSIWVSALKLIETRRRPSRNPTSGPSGHLLPQGEEVACF
jgi:hypothetical protein